MKITLTSFSICEKCAQNLMHISESKIPYNEFVCICGYHAEKDIYIAKLDDPINTILNFLEKHKYITTLETLEERRAKPTNHSVCKNINLYCIDKHHVEDTSL